MRLIHIILSCSFLLFAVVPAVALTPENLISAESKALAGNIKSQVDVGDYYYAKSQYTEALKWYQMAAKQGQFDSRMRIAHMYINGKGVPANLVKGYVLYRKILDNHNLHPESQQYYENYVKDLATKLSPAELAEAEKAILQPWAF